MQVTSNNISSLYITLFNRVPEGSGHKYWFDLARNNGSSLDFTAAQMLASAPSKEFFKGKDSNFDFVNHIYKNLFDKDNTSDSAGVNFWVNHLNAGNSRSSIVVELLNAATNNTYTKPEDIKAQNLFLNKVKAAEITAKVIADIPATGTLADKLNGFTSILKHIKDTSTPINIAQAIKKEALKANLDILTDQKIADAAVAVFGSASVDTTALLNALAKTTADTDIYGSDQPDNPKPDNPKPDNPKPDNPKPDAGDIKVGDMTYKVDSSGKVISIKDGSGIIYTLRNPADLDAAKGYSIATIKTLSSMIQSGSDKFILNEQSKVKSIQTSHKGEADAIRIDINDADFKDANISSYISDKKSVMHKPIIYKNKMKGFISKEAQNLGDLEISEVASNSDYAIILTKSIKASEFLNYSIVTPKGSGIDKGVMLQKGNGEYVEGKAYCIDIRDNFTYTTKPLKHSEYPHKSTDYQLTIVSNDDSRDKTIITNSEGFVKEEKYNKTGLVNISFKGTDKTDTINIYISKDIYNNNINDVYKQATYTSSDMLLDKNQVSMSSIEQARLIDKSLKEVPLSGKILEILNSYNIQILMDSVKGIHIKSHGSKYLDATNISSGNISFTLNDISSDVIKLGRYSKDVKIYGFDKNDKINFSNLGVTKASSSDISNVAMQDKTLYVLTTTKNFSIYDNSTSDLFEKTFGKNLKMSSSSDKDAIIMLRQTGNTITQLYKVDNKGDAAVTHDEVSLIGTIIHNGGVSFGTEILTNS